MSGNSDDEQTAPEIRLGQDIEVIFSRPHGWQTLYDAERGSIISLWRTDSGEIDVAADFGSLGQVFLTASGLKWNYRAGHWRKSSDDRPLDQSWA